MATPLSPDTLSTGIDRFYVRQLRDNFFLGTPLWNKLSENTDVVPGGRQIVDQISYTNSPNAGAWGGGVAQLNSSFVGNMTEVVQNPVFYYFSVAVPDTDDIQNQNPADIINLIEAQAELAEMSLRDTLGSDIYGTGALNAGGYKTLVGLKAMITFGADAGLGPYGGITRVGASGAKNGTPVGNAFWNSNAVAINANGTVTRYKGNQTFGNVTTLSIQPMQSVFGFCTVNNQAPDLMVASMLTYNAYYNQLTSIMRQATQDDLGKQGFTGLMFNNCALVQDDACDTDSIYFLNTKFMKLRPYKRGNFRMTGWRQPADQLVSIKYGIWMGNVTCTRPSMQGRLSAITG